MKPIYLSESLRPYLFISGGVLLLLIFGLVVNSGTIGSLFGQAAAHVNIRYNPYFVAGLTAIYFIRKPYLAIAAATVFAILYQIYHSKFIGTWRLLGIEQPSYFSFSRIFGGIALLSFIGVCHFLIRKLKSGKQKQSINSVVLCVAVFVILTTAPQSALYAEGLKRPTFECTIKEFTPVQHWYVSCENETYRGHITTLNQLDTGARYWSGFVYRIEAGRISDPFINIVVKASASPEGKKPPEKVHCIWVDEDTLLTNCS